MTAAGSRTRSFGEVSKAARGYVIEPRDEAHSGDRADTANAADSADTGRQP